MITMKHKKYILYFCIVVIFLISITTISANDLNASEDYDSLQDIEDSSYTDLHTKIAAEKTSFTFENDYKFNEEVDKNYSGGINITKNNFVINGNNHVIDCNNQARAFDISGKKVEINNLVIKNAFYGNGSAIRVTSGLTLNNVTFINCTGDNRTYYGGAVYSYNTSLNVNNCNFIDNSGDNGASITSISSTVKVANSTFTSSSDNIIKGQIFLENSRLTVDNSNFLNTTSKYAAAIFLRNDGKLKISNTKFKNLYAYKTAGAIGAKVIEDLTINNCEFDNVTSQNNAGAIFTDSFGDGSVFRSDVNINNTSFNNCFSDFGGAILQLDGNLNINNTNFTSNHASYDGGAIYTSYTNVNIFNSKFNSNSLMDDVSYGGACYFDQGEIFLESNKFVNNSASEGLSIYGYDTTLSLTKNYFNNPSDGISICTVYGEVEEDSDNDYTSDVKSFNNTNNFYNFENRVKAISIINNTLSFDKMPEAFDLRKYGWVTPVKDQGFMGSCWAFGNMAALESSLLRYTNTTYSLSVNNMQNSMLMYSKYGVDTIKEGGNPYTSVGYLIDWLGVFPDEFDGYDELGKISSLYITPDDIHIQNVVILPPIKNAADRDLIKSALIKYGAVAVSHCANFDTSKYFNKSSSAQYCYDTKDSTHRVCIVGWDDNYSRYNFLKTPEGDGAWIIKNSWGTQWGDEGYFYLSYYDPSLADKESVCYIIDNDQYTRIYQHDVGGDSKWLPESKYYASVFTADDDEIIGAVGTIFNESGREYEFTVSVNDVEVHTQKGTSKFGGYETIKLDKYVPVKKGDVFKVTFKNTACVAHDLRIHPQYGQSFVSDDTKDWEDLAKVYFVAILKAYALPKVNTDITSDDVHGVTGEKTSATIKVTDEDGNQITDANATLTVNGKNYTGKIVNGTVTFNNIKLNAGNYTGIMTYSGNGIYNPSSTTVNVEINKNPNKPADSENKKSSNNRNPGANIIDNNRKHPLNGAATIIIDGNKDTAQISNATATSDAVLPENMGNNTTEVENQSEISDNKTNDTNQLLDSQTGNLMLIALLALICLIPIILYRRKKE